MLFPSSKILGFLTLPSNLLFLLALAGILLMRTRFARTGRKLLVLAVLLLAVMGISPIGDALMLPLEQRFPKWDASRPAPEGIVVLGGVISPEVSAARGEVALNEAAERVTAIADLARRFPAAKIVFSGGSARLFGGPNEADLVVGLFESFGIARERVLLERHGRNTHENATLTKALVNPKADARWLLVTSAHHMPRSVGTFRRAGFPVEAHPVDWRTRGADGLLTPAGSFANGLARTDAAVHEWVGLFFYWLTGRTSEFFPAP